jgi:hypothetical protein
VEAAPAANGGWQWALAAVLSATIVAVLVGAWSLLTVKRPPSAIRGQVAAAHPSAPPKTAHPAVVAKTSESPAAKLNRRWIPAQTKVLVSARLAALAGRDEFGPVATLAEPYWRPSAGRVLEAFGLRPQVVARITWTSTDLADPSEHGVALIELAEKQDARALNALGEAVRLWLEGVACRRLSTGVWRHPFAVLGPRTIVTGREDLLRELADRTDERVHGVALERFLKAAAAEADLIGVCDVAAARQAGWLRPVSTLDVWPAGRKAWHTVWEAPQAIGVVFRRSPADECELALVCDSETTAQQVRAAVTELIPAARKSLDARVGSITKELQAGRMTMQAADQFDALLKQGKSALGATHAEAAEESVWVHVGLGRGWPGLALAALDSRPAIRAGWLAAALEADSANHHRLAAGLQGYLAAEGKFPMGAAGGELLPPETRLSWIASLLPYYDHLDWHRQLQFSLSWNSKENQPVARRPLETVINPALGPETTGAGFPVTHYVGVAGLGADAGRLKPGDPRAGVFAFGHATRPEEMPRGASNTIAVLGVTRRLGPWASGGDATVRPLTTRPYVNGPDGFGSGQPDGMLAGMADGSVRFISKDVDPEVLEQLATLGGKKDVTVAALDLRPRQAGPPFTPAAPADAASNPADAAAKPSVNPKADEVAVLLRQLAHPGEPNAAPGAKRAKSEVDVSAQLEDRIVGFQWSEKPLGAGVDQLGAILGAPATFDMDALEQLGVSLADPVSVNLRETSVGGILEAMLARRGLIFVVADGMVLVTSPEDRRIQPHAVRYTVTDLAGTEKAGLEDLARRLRKLVAPESWQEAGGRGTIEIADGTWRVVQTDPVHYRILAFCEKLRVARGRPLRSRFPAAMFALATRLDRAQPKLRAPVTLNYRESAPLAEIIAQLAEQTGTTIVVDWLALAAEGNPPQIEATLQVDGRPLAEALDKLLRPLGLTVRAVNASTLEVTTVKALAARRELEIYPVAGLLSPDVTPAAIQQRIKAEAAGAAWSDAGGPGVLDFDPPSKCLLVLQSPAVQAQVEALLARMSAEKAQPPKPAGK